MPRLTEEQRNQALVCYQQGESSESIAKRLGCSGPAIRGLLRRRGVLLRDASACHTKHPFRDDLFLAPDAEARYWLGVLLTDGWVSDTDGTRRTGLCVHERDRELAEQFRAFLQAGHKIGRKRTKTGFSVQLQIRSEKLASSLAWWGVVPRKSLIATPHASLLSCRHFWRGVVDGDGEVNADLASPVLSVCGTKAVADGFADFCRSVFPMYEPSVYPAKVWYTRLHGEGAKQIAAHLYRTDEYGLSRKKEAALLLANNNRTYRILKKRYG